MDRISKDKRSKNMSRIKSKNTKPEILIRKLLFKKGLRYRIHYNLPGKPDIVFLKNKIAIFIHGCFWHGHNCNEGHLPKTDTNFWKEKILGNKKRDITNKLKLKKLGWNVITLWECKIEKELDMLINRLFKLINKNIYGK